MLAIVIPYYKIEFFSDTLESLSNQTDKRFNVYIGDDNSPCSPELLLSNYQFNYVYKKFENNLGGTSLVKQWERCIELINDEEWIMILGDDDFIDKNVVKEYYEAVELYHDKTNLIRFSNIVIDELGEEISKEYKFLEWQTAEESLSNKLLKGVRSSLSEYIFKKETYNKYKFKEYPSAFYSDDQAWLDFSDNKPIYSINRAKIFIRISSKSLSGNKNNIKLIDFAAIQFYINIINSSKFKKLPSNLKYNVLKRLEHLYIKYNKLNFLKFTKLLVYYFKYINKSRMVEFVYKYIRRII